MGLQKTWNVLALSRNRAAVDLLDVALQSASVEIHTGAVRTLVRRTDAASHELIIRHFPQLSGEAQEVLAEAHREMPRRPTAALSKALLQGEGPICLNACNLVLLLNFYDVFPVLVDAAEDRQHRHAAQINATLLRLANLLHHELVEPPGTTTHRRADPFFVRRQVMPALDRSITRYSEHGRLEIVEAFLLLVPAANATLAAILRDPRHACHEPVVASLLASKSTGTMQCLVKLLEDTDAPTAALQVIAQRSDRRFLDLLLHDLKHPVSLRVLHNMDRLSRVPWLEEERAVLLDFEGAAQAVAVELAAGSGIARDSKYDFLALMMQQGLAEARRASCRVLASFPGRRTIELITRALNDPDADVQAAARKLYSGYAPGGASSLLPPLDFSPSPERSR